MARLPARLRWRLPVELVQGKTHQKSRQVAPALQSVATFPDADKEAAVGRLHDVPPRLCAGPVLWRAGWRPG